MGDRSITIIRKKDSHGEYEYSPQCYLHSLGYDTVNIILRSNLRGSDVSYSFARFVGQCCKEGPGNLGVGVWESPDKTTTGWLDTHNEKKSIENIVSYLSPGNNGVFLVDLDSREIHQFSDYFEGDSDKDSSGNPRRKLVGKLSDIHYLDDIGVYESRCIGSSMIKSYEYNPDKEILILTFNNDMSYKYVSVPREIFLKFQHAQSYGKFFNEFIKGIYKSEKMEESNQPTNPPMSGVHETPPPITSLPLDLVIELKQFATITEANATSIKTYIDTLIQRIEALQRKGV